jgi:hypothetical protein
MRDGVVGWRPAGDSEPVRAVRISRHAGHTEPANTARWALTGRGVGWSARLARSTRAGGQTIAGARGLAPPKHVKVTPHAASPHVPGGLCCAIDGMFCIAEPHRYRGDRNVRCSRLDTVHRSAHAESRAGRYGGNNSASFPADRGRAVHSNAVRHLGQRGRASHKRVCHLHGRPHHSGPSRETHHAHRVIGVRGDQTEHAHARIACGSSIRPTDGPPQPRGQVGRSRPGPGARRSAGRGGGRTGQRLCRRYEQ